MKLNVLAVLIVAGATGSLMSMEQNNELKRLNLLLGHNGCIKQYSAENMKHTLKPEIFMHKKITEAVELSERQAFTKALENAGQQQKTITGQYTFDNEKSWVTITPLICTKKDKQKNNFFVKVTPDDIREIRLPKDEMRTAK